ncbi:LysR family transcriptional regulator [Massilia endophytica]|uniref:LysR family transcriptional regulator n=1 Tax=Massilia endophytica TaxID=2899220 RepID=UPI001E337B8C|nr:LysR family transcriptional regulator [Massilia endophytica]UGQ45901.1 LysR family transcriptional regulator [Massilia endophytica]
MHDFTLQELQCFDAVATHGGFEAAAQALHRTHPAVFAAVAKLERRLGIGLFDRTGYRVRLTDEGRAFHARARTLLQEMRSLRRFAAQLALGQESELRVVIGDFCPPRPVLGMLSNFFARYPETRLHLSLEAVGGPVERLLDGEADLIIHGINKRDPALEWIDLGKVRFVPVAAPGLVPKVHTKLRPEQLRSRTQAVIRDTARHSAPQEHFLVEGAHQCTVPDHSTKKEVILQGLAWGHLPGFLVEEELRAGSLVSLAGKHFPGSVEDLVAARRADLPHGPVAQALWNHIQDRRA